MSSRWRTSRSASVAEDTMAPHLAEDTMSPRTSEARFGVSRSVGALLVEMAAILAPSLGADAAREARELLAALHDMPRYWPTTARAEPLDVAAWRRPLAAAARRARGTPLQYAAGRAAFRHLTLDIDERVLIPRPETEQLIEIVLRLSAGD